MITDNFNVRPAKDEDLIWGIRGPRVTLETDFVRVFEGPESRDSDSPVMDEDLIAAIEWAKASGQPMLRPIGRDITDSQLCLIVKELPQIQSLGLRNSRLLSNEGIRHLRSLEHLHSLALNGCTNVTGAALASISSIDSLRWLSLENEQIAGAELVPLRRLRSLSTLIIACQSLSYWQLNAIASLSSLVSLAIRGCRDNYDNHYLRLRDEDLQNLSALTLLQKLDISGARFTGEGLANLSRLESLRLNGCPEITEQGIATFGTLPNLANIEMCHCLILNNWAKALAKIKTLRSLTLGEHVHNYALQHLRNANMLEVLSMERSGITDEGLRHIRFFPQLKELHLSGCTGVSNIGLAHLMGCRTLEKLDVTDTSVRGIKWPILRSRDAGLILKALGDTNDVFNWATRKELARATERILKKITPAVIGRAAKAKKIKVNDDDLVSVAGFLAWIPSWYSRSDARSGEAAGDCTKEALEQLRIEIHTEIRERIKR